MIIGLFIILERRKQGKESFHPDSFLKEHHSLTKFYQNPHKGNTVLFLFDFSIIHSSSYSRILICLSLLTLGLFAGRRSKRSTTPIYTLVCHRESRFVDSVSVSAIRCKTIQSHCNKQRRVTYFTLKQK